MRRGAKESLIYPDDFSNTVHPELHKKIHLKFHTVFSNEVRIPVHRTSVHHGVIEHTAIGW